jgi:hypothetical protein
VFFPTRGPPLRPPRGAVGAALVPFNRSLNERQLLAVRGILEARARPRPYLVYGPPGTGGSFMFCLSVYLTFEFR